MAVAPIGVLDLSAITDGLINVLKTCIAQSPLWGPGNPGPPFHVDVTGFSPEERRDVADCQLSLYLFHVAENRFTRTLELEGKVDPLRPIRYSPLGLDLYYLLTAHAKNAYVQEQQVMGIALRCFHDNPIFPLVKPRVYLGIETESSDELARLWQSFTVPLRLAAIYRVSVALMSPEDVVAPPAPHPRFVNIDALATALPLAPGGQTIGTTRTLTYRKQDGSMSDPVDLAPARVPIGPGQPFSLYFASPLAPAAIHIWLLQPGAADADVTAWLQQPLAPPDGLQRFRAILAVPVAGAPAPGVFQLAIGTAADAQTNGTPFSIAPRVDVTASPPLLTPVGSTYTLAGQGFTAGATEVLLDTVALAEGAPAAGFFQVAGGTQITFQAPAGMTPGRYAVRVRAGRVEADPGWWVQL